MKVIPVQRHEEMQLHKLMVCKQDVKKHLMLIHVDYRMSIKVFA